MVYLYPLISINIHAHPWMLNHQHWRSPRTHLFGLSLAIREPREELGVALAAPGRSVGISFWMKKWWKNCENWMKCIEIHWSVKRWPRFTRKSWRSLISVAFPLGKLFSDRVSSGLRAWGSVAYHCVMPGNPTFSWSACCADDTGGYSQRCWK